MFRDGALLVTLGILGGCLLGCSDDDQPKGQTTNAEGQSSTARSVDLVIQVEPRTWHTLDVSVTNTGNWPCVYVDRLGLQFNTLVEIFDSRKRLLQRLPLWGGYSPVSPEPLWTMLRPKETIQGTVSFLPHLESNLTPGVYYVRVGFPATFGVPMHYSDLVEIVAAEEDA